jgi:adenylate cyclase
METILPPLPEFRKNIDSTLFKLYNHPLLSKIEPSKLNELKRKVYILKTKMDNEKSIIEELKTDYRNELYKLVFSINTLLEEVKELAIEQEKTIDKDELERIKTNIDKCSICQLKFMKGDVIAYCNPNKIHSHIFHYYCLKNSVDLTTKSTTNNKLLIPVDCPYCHNLIEYKFKSNYSNPWFSI